MGYMRHHAIVVTSWDIASLQHAHDVASGYFDWVSPISPRAMNYYRSFFIPPDGSKEGWEESNDGDDARDQFIEWLELQCYEDGSSCYDWVEVQYGDANLETKVIRDSDMCMRREERIQKALKNVEGKA